MVDTGGSSQACFACRERRVKCDMQKPRCQRCKTVGRTCPGFPDGWTLIHRRQNETAQLQVSTRMKRRLQQTQNNSIMPTFIPRALDVSAELQSLAQFYEDYSMHSHMPLFNDMPLFQTSDTIGVCQYAMIAVSLASAARQHFQSGLMVKARMHYGKAIARANAALSDQAAVEDDSLLMGLFLAGMFEIVVAERPVANTVFSSKTYHPHANGALALLQVRAQRRRFTNMDKVLFTFLSHVTLMEMLVSPDSDTRAWFEFERFASSWTNGVALDPIVRTAVITWLQAQIVMTRPKGQIVEVKALTLAESGLKTAKDLGALAESINLSAREDCTGQSLFNGLLTSSTTTNRAVARSLYRSVGLHLLEATFRLLTGPEHAFHEPLIASTLHSQCQAAITDSVDAICEDLKVILALDGKKTGDKSPGMPYRGFWSLWPIVVILSSPFADARQKSWAQESVGVVWKRTGIGLASLLHVSHKRFARTE